MPAPILSAKWIASPKDAGEAAYTFQTSLTLTKPVKKATLYASAIGLYTLRVNGRPFGDAVLMPGWTSYRKRVQYQTFDLTAALAGTTELAFTVGQGWAVGTIGRINNRHFYADHVSLIACLCVTYVDGTKARFVTNESWKVYTSEVLYSEIYHGETVDKTAPVVSVGHAVPSEVSARLIPQEGEWIREQERLAPVAVFTTPKGERVIDFGQNLAGYAEVTITAPRGSRVVLHHAEVLDGDGNFYNANLRGARCENVYVCSGGRDVFKPSFTFQGFRYVRLTEYPFDTVDPDAFRAVVVHSDMRRTGRFLCGNEKINQLYHNIVWGQKSNYIDVPTDCPQRDERLGWTGDAQVFCRTGAVNFDVKKFFAKWMGDVAADQYPDGGLAGTIPVARAEWNGGTRDSAAWGDAACIVPWEIYLAYGDRALLKKQFPVMKKWVDHVRAQGPAEYLWLGGSHYGDWLAMDAGGDSYVGATSNDLIATAFYAYSTSLLVKAGEAIGRDVTAYRTLYARIREAFRAYFMENGMPKNDYPYTEVVQKQFASDKVRRGVTQTALTLILHFDLCDEEERPALAAKLAELIRENGDRMTTGFVGTPYLLHALSENGYTDVAYTLLMQEKAPSWLYSVTHGATTMWEHWNSLKEDGTFWSTDMNSFNHYAYGAVFDWIFGISSGIKPVASAPGYAEVEIAPHPDKCLGFADASIETRHGFIRSYWYYKGDVVYYEFEIPAGVTARVTLPSGRTETLYGGNYLFAE